MGKHSSKASKLGVDSFWAAVNNQVAYARYCLEKLAAAQAEGQVVSGIANMAVEHPDEVVNLLELAGSQA